MDDRERQFTAASRFTITQIATIDEVGGARPPVPVGASLRLRLGYWLSLALTIVLTAAAVEMLRLGWPHGLRGLGPWAVGTMISMLVAAAIARWFFRQICRQPAARRPFLFAHILVLLVGVFVIFCLRVALRPVVPSWPYRDLRPTTFPHDAAAPTELAAGQDSYSAYNSWGMRDLERKVRKPAGKQRILFIGDSFLEGGYCSFPLPLLTEKLLHEQGRTEVECVNLGVSGTDPADYYDRLREVGGRCSPDAVYVFLYAGNDFIVDGRQWDAACRSLVTNWVVERPRPSLTGAYVPELNWLLCNRLNWSRLAQGQARLPDEGKLFAAWTAAPFADAVEPLSNYLQQTYFPNKEVRQVRAVLERGGPKLWAELKPKPRDQEYLQGWLLQSVVNLEFVDPHPVSSADQVDSAAVNVPVSATFTWLKGIDDLCKGAGVPLVVALCPGGWVDPQFMAFWEPWPSYRAINFLWQARHATLRQHLVRKGFHVVDLAETLNGVDAVYRKTDAHWNEKGHRLVADRMRSEILRMR